jgi:hypothetical protein
MECSTLQQLIDLLCIYYIDTCYVDGDGGDDYGGGNYCDRDNAGDVYGGGCGVGDSASGSVTVSVMVTITVLVIIMTKEMMTVV